MVSPQPRLGAPYEQPSKRLRIGHGIVFGGLWCLGDGARDEIMLFESEIPTLRAYAP